MHLDSSKISVIVPVYKAEAYLHRCVDSLLAQTSMHARIIGFGCSIRKMGE